MARRTTEKPNKSADVSKSSKPCPIVGIGASAGGYHALEKLLPQIEADSGLAYVIIQHLDPHQKSHLVELLSRSADIPVIVAENDVAVEPDHIYVIAPNTVLSVHGGVLQVTLPAEEHLRRFPIDKFFVSLAEDRAENAACVILSGAGSDGTIGLRAIKENGGLAIAQAGAEFDGMMRSALATNLVDFVLPAEAIPKKLADYFRHASDAEKAGLGGDGRSEAADYLMQVCTLLRARTGHDFSGYKDRTLVRRIQRRMQVLQVASVPDFLERLRKEPQEIDLLFQDLLIGVTQFFRDAKAWDELEKVIASLFEGKGADDTIRVWVPGCSTGEEAYSIAMLLREYAPKNNGMPKLQIFASDIDESALEIARIGRYPASIANDIPPRRLERYFLREDGTYRIASDLREICLFSVHNLLRDAPFSKLDLVSCRNLLIYLSTDVQSRVIPLFHYALREGGYLFLGSSENVTRHPRLFGTQDKAQRIFYRRPQVERRLPEFPLTTPDTSRRGVPSQPRPATHDGSVQSLAERMLLDRYSPAYVVVDSDGELLQSSGRTGKYLELPAGVPSSNVFNMARRGLRLDLRAALHRAATTNAVVVQNNIVIGTNGGRQNIDLIVQPLHPDKAPDSLYMVVFQDIGGIKPESDEQDVLATEDVENLNLRQLESELRLTKERLQTTTEELESSNEELKSGNEELSSMNEELQSANEELETSKEELQSINEELQTVNSELNSRVEELSRANSDIANLLEATQIATVFLDQNLSVKGFTPAAKDLFHLVESNTGRPIAHVRTRFDNDTVQSDAERVLRTLATIEREVKGTDNESRYVMRILPYRTVENVIAGVVITFNDITKVSAAEARISDLSADLRNRVESLETLLDLVPVGIFLSERRDGSQMRANCAGTNLLGLVVEGKGLHDAGDGLTLFVGDREVPLSEQPLQRAIRTGVPVHGFGARLVQANGASRDVIISATPLFGEDGQARGAIAAMADVSDLKRSEAQREVLLHELQHRVKNILATISSLSTRMVRTSATVDEFSAAFLSRLLAMGSMHELLSARGWEGADLRALIALAVKPLLGTNPATISLEGPAIDLTPNAAATLGMVFHELATNAAKYGALSAPNGKIAVSWKIETSKSGFELALNWSEMDGPRVEMPESEGFGVTFLKKSIEYELDGTADCEFIEKGVQCAIRFPFDRNIEPLRRKGTNDGESVS